MTTQACSNMVIDYGHPQGKSPPGVDSLVTPQSPYKH